MVCVFCLFSNVTQGVGLRGGGGVGGRLGEGVWGGGGGRLGEGGAIDKTIYRMCRQWWGWDRQNMVSLLIQNGLADAAR